MLHTVLSAVLFLSPLLYGADLKLILQPFQILIFSSFLVHFHNPAGQIQFSALPRMLWAGWGGLAVILCVSTLYSVYPDLSLKFLMYFFAVSALFLLATFGRLSQRQVIIICGVMIFSSDLQVIIGILQKMDILSHRHWIPKDLMAGTFINHNRFSGMMEITLPLVLSLLFVNRLNTGGLFKIFLIFSLVFQTGGLILAQSRAGWLSAFAGVLYFFIAASEKFSFRRIVSGMTAVILIASAFIYLNQETLGKRFETLLALDKDSSAQARIKFWKAGAEIIRDHPFSGTGPATFPVVFPKYRPEDVRYYVNQIHNDYLGWMAEAGILTFPCLLILLFIFVLRPFRERGNPLAAAAGSAVLAMALHSVVDYNLRIPAITFYLAVLTGLSFRKKTKSG